MAKTELPEFTPEDETSHERVTNGEVVNYEPPRTVALNLGEGSAKSLPVTELREMTYAQLVEIIGKPADATDAIGTDQFGPVLNDKDRLVGVGFVIVHFEVHKSKEYGGDFVSAWVMTEDGTRYIVNDGSTGLAKQLIDLKEKTGKDSMIVCRHGLRVSTYDKDLPNGKTIKDAKTFYIDTAL